MSDQSIDSRVEVGRVVLDVGDIARSRAFYERVLGFSPVPGTGSSTVFLTAGGAHHHVVLRATGPAGTPWPPSAPGLSLRLPTREALADAVRRLKAAGVSIDRADDLGVVESVWVTDPDGHRIELYAERAQADWPGLLGSDGRISPRPLDLHALLADRPAAEPSRPPRDQPVTAGLADGMRARLREMRTRLLNLHKVLLDDARAAYELDRGHIGSNANLLQLVINDPWFAWLHPLSELVVRIDEVLQPDAPSTDADGAILLEQVATLLAPGQDGGRFAERYYEALQRQPAVIVAHAEVRRILKEAR